MLQLILGEAGTGKTTETLRRIRASAARQQPALLLVPEHASFEMERRVSALFTAEEQRYVTLYSFPPPGGKHLPGMRRPGPSPYG